MKRLFVKLQQKAVALVTGMLAQGTSNNISGDKTLPLRNAEICGKAAAEGIVLLRNDGTLPLDYGARIALFGRCNYDFFFVGYGSGGEVHSPERVSLSDALKERGSVIDEGVDSFYESWRYKNPASEGFWGFWPYSHPEAVIPEKVLRRAQTTDDVAIITIGRASGEDRENKLKKGSFYLTDKERKLIKSVTESFSKTVLILDVGNVIDLSFIDEFDFSAVLLCWLGGMESGRAITRVLYGEENPSGKLVSTVAKTYEDYPSKAYFGNKKYNEYVEDVFVGYRYFETFAKNRVLFPFGYGLSYTSFKIKNTEFSFDGNVAKIAFSVKNTGERAGKEVAQIYVSQPNGKLGKPDRQLVFYKKTPLLKPGESVNFECVINKYEISSYDDSGASGNRFCYVAEEGEYAFYIGNNVRDAVKCGSFVLEKTEVIERLEQICPPKENFKRIKAVLHGGEKRIAYEDAPPKAFELRERILSRIERDVPFSGDKGYKLVDVKNGKISLNEFIAQLTDEELARLTIGDVKMNSPLGAAGNAGAFGGVCEELRAKGIPPVITTDGPAGIRLARYATLMPCGTCLASTWNDDLVQELTSLVAEEMRALGSDVLLAPGMNIHRNPLCGRNFEYFSEDPYLSGKIAAAYVKGIQSGGLSACPKHFACNNQETNRTRNDSRVSERALREIYLKGFEICVKESLPLNVMTSYNKINGVWSHYNYDLCATALRKEWGYEGNVMTDWWMRRSASPEFDNVEDNAYRVRAQADVLMPGAINYSSGEIGDSIKRSLAAGGLKRAELVTAAKHILRMAMNFCEKGRLAEDEEQK